MAARVIPTVLGGLAVAGGLLCTFMLVILFFAGMPNSKPDELRVIKLYTWGVFLGGIVCAAGGIVLLITGRPWWGAGMGVLPVLGMMVLFTRVSTR
jgi:hypothetical protein